MPVHTTDRLSLRRFTEDDAPLLHALDSDPEVMRYISKGEPTSLKKIEQEILPGWLRYYEQYEHWGFFAAHRRAGGEFVGWFHLRPDRHEPQALELGYRLKRSAWGQGLAAEGARALIDMAFTAWGADRIVAHTLVGNAASRRVMEKCGLRFERTFTVVASLRPGWSEEERQSVTYGLYRDAYRQPSSPDGRQALSQDHPRRHAPDPQD